MSIGRVKTPYFSGYLCAIAFYLLTGAIKFATVFYAMIRFVIGTVDMKGNRHLGMGGHSLLPGVCLFQDALRAR